MSEPASFYAKIIISPSAREEFLQSKVPNASEYKDWLSWLATEKYSGELTDQDIANINYRRLSTGEYLNSWITDSYTHGFESYDEETGVWILAMYEFAENYLDFISFLNALRNVQKYKDTDSEDCILIHSYIWGDTEMDVNILLSKTENKISKDISKSLIEEAAVCLVMIEKKLSAQ